MAELGDNSESAARQRVATRRTLSDEEAAIQNHDHHDHLSPVVEKPHHHHHQLHLSVPEAELEGFYRFWRRFTRHGKKKVGVVQSLRAFLFFSCIYSFCFLSDTESLVDS
jgi:Ca2+:H+ antiporter